MLAKIRRSANATDEGFTLIELLVIVLIIGVLAAIAIPVLLGQRKKATEASMKTDLRTIANTLETYYVDRQNYPPVAASDDVVTVGGTDIKLSGKNYASVTLTTVNGTSAFCVAVTNPDVGGGTADAGWYFNSAKGGIQERGAGCA